MNLTELNFNFAIDVVSFGHDGEMTQLEHKYGEIFFRQYKIETTE